MKGSTPEPTDAIAPRTPPAGIPLLPEAVEPGTPPADGELPCAGAPALDDGVPVTDVPFVPPETLAPAVAPLVVVPVVPPVVPPCVQEVVE